MQVIKLKEESVKYFTDTLSEESEASRAWYPDLTT